MDVIIGLGLGIICYKTFLEPVALQSCLVDSENCVRVLYKKKNNTVLCKELRSGKVIWYNGRDVLLYNESTGRLCPDPYSPTYVWNLVTNTPRGYLSAKNLREVENIYQNQPWSSISIKVDGTIDLIGLINFLIDQRVIILPKN